MCHKRRHIPISNVNLFNRLDLFIELSGYSYKYIHACGVHTMKQISFPIRDIIFNILIIILRWFAKQTNLLPHTASNFDCCTLFEIKFYRNMRKLLERLNLHFNLFKSQDFKNIICVVERIRFFCEIPEKTTDKLPFKVLSGKL